jgi:hypothetical protein
VWAPAATNDRIRAELEAERSTEGYAKKKETAARRRTQVQAEYVEDFQAAVFKFLAFHPVYADLADRLARAVTPPAMKLPDTSAAFGLFASTTLTWGPNRQPAKRSRQMESRFLGRRERASSKSSRRRGS